MRKGSIMIVFMTAGVLAALLLGLRSLRQDEPLSFSLSGPAASETIVPWADSSGNLVVFLPSYADMSQLTLQSGHVPALANRRSCESLIPGEPYPLDNGRTLTFLISENLPTMYIDTRSHSMDYVHQDKGNEEKGSLRLYRADGTLDYKGMLDSIKMHGNNWTFQEKEPYNLKLSGQADLLGMGAAKKWILFSNSFDPTHMRNKIVYDFAAQLGLPFTPECEWVELYLNGEYAGLYLLSERNEVAPGRVELKDNRGFLLSKEIGERLVWQNLPFFWAAGGNAMRIRYSTMDEDSLSYVWYRLYQAITAENGIDPESGLHWSELIDLDSWAKKYLIEESFGNPDGGNVSQFFFAEEDGPIFAGPVWDYDMAMGNRRIFSYMVPEMFYVKCPSIYKGSAWYSALYQDPNFYDYMTQVYREKFRPLMEQVISDRLDSYASFIAASARLNHIRWGGIDMDTGMNSLRDYLSQQILFLDHLWIEQQPYLMLTIRFPDGRHATYAISEGNPAPEILSSIKDKLFTSDQVTPYDLEAPIYADTLVYYLEPSAPQDPPEETPLQEDTSAEPAAQDSSETPLFLLSFGALLLILGAAILIDRKQR